MIKDVNLLSYLPPFMQEYEETAACLNAEDPEFVLLWNGTERVLNNEFIETADAYGIGRFEKLLGIYPSREDTLESRRSRIQARWFNMLPYTFRVFLRRLETLCGGQNFKLTKSFEDQYLLEIESYLELFGQVEELVHIIDTMIPCNMVVRVVNKILCSAEGALQMAGMVCAIEAYLITNDFRQTWVAEGELRQGARTVVAEFFTVGGR